MTIDGKMSDVGRYWHVPDFPMLMCRNLVISDASGGLALPQNTLNSCL